MARKKLAAEALALIYLREERRWSLKELAEAKGLADYRPISRYHTGEIPLSRRELDAMAELLGHSREAVEALLFTHSLVSPPAPPDNGSPVQLTPEELRRVDRAVIAHAWTRAAELRAELIADRRRRKAEEARRAAGALWARLKTLPPKQRRELVGDSADLQSWALVERLCLESARAAADNASKAQDLADLALLAATRVEGTEAWRRRLQGYAWAYIANARRVANTPSAANDAFARAWDLWNAGEDAGLLPEWRLLSLEASMRRDERRCEEALQLLDRARKTAGGDPEAQSAILLKRAFVCEQMGDLDGSLSALDEAVPLVKAKSDRRLLLALHFEKTKCLCALNRFKEAEEALSTARELAEGLGNELDLLRVVWLAAHVAAGQGRREEAIASLEQVRWAFASRDLPSDAALAALELAVLLLKDGQTGEVKTLAREMAPIFQAQGIAREALATFALFHEAAQQETATVELALRAIAEIQSSGGRSLRYGTASGA